VGFRALDAAERDAAAPAAGRRCPERHRSVLSLDAAAALGQDAAELALDANERPARPAGRR